MVTLAVLTKYFQNITKMTTYMSNKSRDVIFSEEKTPTASQPRQGLVKFEIRQFIENPW
jgi:hypothetical protein